MNPVEEDEVEEEVEEVLSIFSGAESFTFVSEIDIGGTGGTLDVGTGGMFELGFSEGVCVVVVG